MKSADTDNAGGKNKLVKGDDPTEGAGQTECQGQFNTAEAQTSSDKENLENSSHKAFKIYQRCLENVSCSRVGDASFFGTKKAWTRLNHDFPISVST